MVVSLLIVDDHPAMIEGYKSILSYNSLGMQFDITTARNCIDGYNMISSNINFDMIFLDIILPTAEEFKLKSGIDLALFAREKQPSAKIVFLTSHTESFVLYSVIKDVRPEGLLVKSDFTANDLLLAFDRIFQGFNTFSPTVHKSIKDISRKNIYLDSYNRKIISLLANGIKTKNLPQYLNLSISAIDKRKAQIKEYFEIEKGTDEDIIREARNCGFI